MVFARNEFDPNGPIDAKIVQEKFERTGRILHLHLPDNRIIRTTPEHPFYVADKGWTAAGALEAGDQVRTANGWTTVEDLFDTGEYEKVYNIRVADWHTYFVGEEGRKEAVWAHNACFPHLQGADRNLSELGKDLALLAQQAFSSIPAAHRRATVAVTKVVTNNTASYVFSIYGDTRAFAAIEAFAAQMGATVFHASGVHAEVDLYQRYSAEPGFCNAIGHSNYNGTCENVCVPFFNSIGFKNVWWPPDRA